MVVLLAASNRKRKIPAIKSVQLFEDFWGKRERMGKVQTILVGGVKSPFLLKLFGVPVLPCCHCIEIFTISYY